jgi:hypothetical protein
MELLFNILRNHGVEGLILVVALYIIIKSSFTIEYPRERTKGK